MERATITIQEKETPEKETDEVIAESR